MFFFCSRLRHNVPHMQKNIILILTFELLSQNSATVVIFAEEINSYFPKR